MNCKKKTLVFILTFIVLFELASALPLRVEPNNIYLFSAIEGQESVLQPKSMLDSFALGAANLPYDVGANANIDFAIAFEVPLISAGRIDDVGLSFHVHPIDQSIFSSFLDTSNHRDLNIHAVIVDERVSVASMNSVLAGSGTRVNEVTLSPESSGQVSLTTGPIEPTSGMRSRGYFTLVLLESPAHRQDRETFSLREVNLSRMRLELNYEGASTMSTGVVIPDPEPVKCDSPRLGINSLPTTVPHGLPPFVVVSGTVSPRSTIEYRINGDSLDAGQISASGDFRLPLIRLQEGNNTITLTATPATTGCDLSVTNDISIGFDGSFYQSLYGERTVPVYSKIGESPGTLISLQSIYDGVSNGGCGDADLNVIYPTKGDDVHTVSGFTPPPIRGTFTFTGSASDSSIESLRWYNLNTGYDGGMIFEGSEWESIGFVSLHQGLNVILVSAVESCGDLATYPLVIENPRDIAQPVFTTSSLSLSSLVGDFNGDGCVDSLDHDEFVDAFNAVEGDNNYDVIYDVVPNGVIDFADHLEFIGHFLEGDCSDSPDTIDAVLDFDGQGFFGSNRGSGGGNVFALSDPATFLDAGPSWDDLGLSTVVPSLGVVTSPIIPTSIASQPSSSNVNNPPRDDSESTNLPSSSSAIPPTSLPPATTTVVQSDLIDPANQANPTENSETPFCPFELSIDLPLQDNSLVIPPGFPGYFPVSGSLDVDGVVGYSFIVSGVTMSSGMSAIADNGNFDLGVVATTREGTLRIDVEPTDCQEISIDIPVLATTDLYLLEGSELPENLFSTIDDIYSDIEYDAVCRSPYVALVDGITELDVPFNMVPLGGEYDVADAISYYNLHTGRVGNLEVNSDGTWDTGSSWLSLREGENVLFLVATNECGGVSGETIYITVS